MFEIKLIILRYESYIANFLNLYGRYVFQYKSFLTSQLDKFQSTPLRNTKKYKII